MKKIIMLLLVLFITIIYSVNSLKIFEIEETEKLSLGLQAEDPDADKLAYTFTSPLDANGEWQTNYGDAGEYKSIISVSDGTSEVSEEVLIIVSRKEAKPVIDSSLPEEEFIAIDEGKTIKFKVEVSDLNTDKLSYEWLVNDEFVSDMDEMSFDTDYNDAGDYVVRFVVSDGVFDVSREWKVKVSNVDVEGLLQGIEDVIVFETETASIKLPDFGKYGLTYEIQEPFGDNKWVTGYDHAGEYTVKINVEGGGFKGEKDVNIIVKNKDRAPEFIGLKDVTVNENENVRIDLKAVDPDDNAIILSVEDIPEDAELDGNVFTWKPGYDFVQKNNAFDYVLDKFMMLRKSVNVIFVAQSNELSNRKNVKITVKDVNRPFILDDIEGIEVDEGNKIIIDPKYNDPDNDKVSFAYSGFMTSARKKTTYDDAGEYVVKIIATDGYHTETRFIDVKVNDINRKPMFDKIENVEVNEGDEVKIELSASDPDNDAIIFFADDLPEGAVLKDNLFVWTPGFDVVNGTKKEFSVDFFASDGTDEDTQKVKIIVLNVNQAPEIISYSDNLIALKDKPVLFEVNADDIDGDELTYKWKFGFFDEYEDGNEHQRIFSTAGSKKVEVIISDGIESVSKVWNVEVV
ncbi:MAG: hypothetical protein V1831_02450 [Candidatus Woesearchaeota archaeon]